MHKLEIETSRGGHWLNLIIWCDVTNFIHTHWPLCPLHNSESNFLSGTPGGRFKDYQRDVRTHCVVLKFKEGAEWRKLPIILEWIAENVQDGWSLDFDPAEPVEIGSGIHPMTIEADFKLYFANPGDALLCMLRFV